VLTFIFLFINILVLILLGRFWILFLWGTQTPGNSAELALTFLSRLTLHINSYKNTQCCSANLSISNTQGILKNTESHVSITREYNRTSLYHWYWHVATCGNQCSDMHSGEAMLWGCCQTSLLYNYCSHANQAKQVGVVVMLGHVFGRYRFAYVLD
jgi:hypothetical protein